MSGLSKFQDLSKDWPPHVNMTKAARMVVDSYTGNETLRGLDFGCGSGRDSVYMANLGMQVTAVDSRTDHIEDVARSNLLILSCKTRFDEFKFGEYDLISSQFSLSFNPLVLLQKCSDLYWLL
jgi:2-polyprenyl-3-methyl-5-hydroxy-6-metoxy-1,4-benzoquinol methylase